MENTPTTVFPETLTHTVGLDQVTSTPTSASSLATSIATTTQQVSIVPSTAPISTNESRNQNTSPENTNDSQKNTQENKSEVSANRIKLLCHFCGETVYKNKFCRHLKQHPEGTHEKKPCNFCGKLISTKKEL